MAGISNVGYEVVDQIRNLVPPNPVRDFPMEFASQIGLIPGANAGRAAMAPSTGVPVTTAENPSRGMVTSPLNMDAVRTFSNRVNPPGQLTGNINNLPPGDFFKMLFNPDITTAPTAAPTTVGVVPAARTLPPEFEASKPPGVMDQVQNLIQQYQGMLKDYANPPTGATLADFIKRKRSHEILDNFSKNFGTIMDKLMAGEKLPGEMGLANAQTVNLMRPHTFTWPSGTEGQQTASLIDVLGGKRDIGTGTPYSKITAQDRAIQHAMPMFTQIMKIRDDKKIMGGDTSQEDAMLSRLYPIVMSQFGGGPPTKPTREQFLAAAKAAPQNKGKTDQQILDYYYKNYGR